MPGIEITDEDRKKIDAKFICTVCNLLLCLPMQTSCGHLMCYACLQTLLDGSPKCPADGSGLVKEKAFPDAFTRRELKSLHLHCSNPGCPWYGLYEELELHSKACGIAIIRCVNEQCKEMFQQSHLGKHLETECEYQNVKYEYRGQVGNPVASKREHVDMDCEATRQAFVLKQDVKEHEQSCNENSTVEGNDQEREVLDQLNEPIHNTNLLFNFILNSLRMGISNALSLFMEYVSNYEKREIREARFRLLQSIRMLEVEQEENRNLVKKNLQQDACIQSLCIGLDRKEKSFTSHRARIDDLQRARLFPISSNGVLVWKIDEFQRKFQDAASGAQAAMYSPPFYSSSYGYKMCVKIFPNGVCGSARGTHISLFFVLMKGEHDAILTFPFQARVTLMLLDQPDGEHIVNVQNITCSLPTSDMNVVSGSAQFIPIDKLYSRAYIQDDVMFIKVIVEVESNVVQQ